MFLEVAYLYGPQLHMRMEHLMECDDLTENYSSQDERAHQIEAHALMRSLDDIRVNDMKNSKK